MRLKAKTFRSLCEAGVFIEDDAIHEGAASPAAARKTVRLGEEAEDRVMYGVAPLGLMLSSTRWDHFHNDEADPVRSRTPAARHVNWKRAAALCEEHYKMKVPDDSLRLIFCGDEAAACAILEQLTQCCRRARPLSDGPRRRQTAVLDPLLDQIMLMSSTIHQQCNFLQIQQTKTQRFMDIQNALVETVKEEQEERDYIQLEREAGLVLAFDLAQCYCLAMDSASRIASQERAAYEAIRRPFLEQRDSLAEVEARWQLFVKAESEWILCEEMERLEIQQEERRVRAWGEYLWLTEQEESLERGDVVVKEHRGWVALVRRIFSVFGMLAGTDALRVMERSHREVLEQSYYREITGLMNTFRVLIANRIASERERTERVRKAIQERRKQLIEESGNRIANHTRALAAKPVDAAPVEKKLSKRDFWATNPQSQRAEEEAHARKQQQQQNGRSAVPSFSPRSVDVEVSETQTEYDYDPAEGPSDRNHELTSQPSFLSDVGNELLYIRADVPVALRHLGDDTSTPEGARPTPRTSSRWPYSDRSPLDGETSQDPTMASTAGKAQVSDAITPAELTPRMPRWYRERPVIDSKSILLAQRFMRAALSVRRCQQLFVKQNRGTLELIASTWFFKTRLPSLQNQTRKRIIEMSHHPVRLNEESEIVVERSTTREEHWIPAISLTVSLILSTGCPWSRCGVIALAFLEWVLHKHKRGLPPSNVNCPVELTVMAHGTPQTAIVPAHKAWKYSSAMCPECQKHFERCLGLQKLKVTDLFYAHSPVARQFYNNNLAILTINYAQAVLRCWRAANLVANKMRSKVIQRNRSYMGMLIRIQCWWRYSRRKRLSAPYDGTPGCAPVLIMLGRRLRHARGDPSVGASLPSYEAYLCSHRPSPVSDLCDCRQRFRFLADKWRKERFLSTWIALRFAVLARSKRSMRMPRADGCCGKCGGVLDILEKRLNATPGAVHSPTFWIYQYVVCKRNVACIGRLEALRRVAADCARIASFVRLRFRFVARCRDQALVDWQQRHVIKTREGGLCARCSIFYDSMRHLLQHRPEVSERRLQGYMKQMCRRCWVTLPSTVGKFLKRRRAAAFVLERFEWIRHYKHLRRHPKKERSVLGACSTCSSILRLMQKRIYAAPKAFSEHKFRHAWLPLICTTCADAGKRAAAQWTTAALPITPQVLRDASLVQGFVRAWLSRQEIDHRKANPPKLPPPHHNAVLSKGRIPAMNFPSHALQHPQRPASPTATELVASAPPMRLGDVPCADCGTMVRRSDEWCYHCGAWQRDLNIEAFTKL